LATDHEVELIADARGEPRMTTRLGAIEVSKAMEREEPTCSLPFPWIRMRQDGAVIKLEVRFGRESAVEYTPKSSEVIQMLCEIGDWLRANARSTEDVPASEQ
jgi:hypothetical protein